MSPAGIPSQHGADAAPFQERDVPDVCGRLVDHFPGRFNGTFPTGAVMADGPVSFCLYFELEFATYFN
jgi:hypothetical protein